MYENALKIKINFIDKYTYSVQRTVATSIKGGFILCTQSVFDRVNSLLVLMVSSDEYMDYGYGVYDFGVLSHNMLLTQNQYCRVLMGQVIGRSIARHCI